MISLLVGILGIMCGLFAFALAATGPDRTMPMILGCAAVFACVYSLID